MFKLSKSALSPSLAFSLLLPLLSAAIAHAQQTDVSRYDLYTGYTNLNSPALGLNENGFHLQAGYNPKTWYSLGFDYSVSSGDLILTTPELTTADQQLIAGAIQLYGPAFGLPANYALAVPTHSFTQTFAAGPQYEYRHSAQLNAIASVGGSFAYTPALSSIPSAGTDTLSVVFTPTDGVNYSSVTKSVQIIVTQATPIITWGNPAAISFGTTLSTTQLNATTSVDGSFVYSPAAGSTPATGTDTLSVTFTRADHLWHGPLRNSARCNHHTRRLSRHSHL